MAQLLEKHALEITMQECLDNLEEWTTGFGQPSWLNDDPTFQILPETENTLYSLNDSSSWINDR